MTLAGQSAGSSSALYHLMSPRSEGLFQRVIAQSGSNFSPSLHSITAREAARFGNEASIALGCVLGDFGDRRLECLQGDTHTPHQKRELSTRQFKHHYTYRYHARS